MNILITGANGFIGNKIYNALSQQGTDKVIGIDKNELNEIESVDVSDQKAFSKFLIQFEPELIIHTAAVKDLMSCEQNKDTAFKTNVLSTETIADYIKKHNKGTKVIYISSDVVFDGKDGNYDPQSTPNPINWYGKTKLFSEIILKNIQNYCILRTALVIGDLNDQYSSILNFELGNSVLQNQTLLPHYVFNRLSRNMPINLPTDIISNPTPVDLLIEIVIKLKQNFKVGVFHAAGSTSISRYDFARTIAKKFNFETDLVNIDNSKILDIRPKNISMNVEDSLKTLAIDPAEWEVDKYINTIKFVKI